MTEELTIERAAELILAEKAWKPCILCQGQGNISQKRAEELDLIIGGRLPECEVCEGAGYLPPRGLQEAYRITGTPYPEKPMSGPDFYTKTMRQVQNTINQKMQGYIGQVGVNPKRLVDEVAKSLEALNVYLPEPTITVEADPTDPTLMNVSVKYKE